MRARSFVIAVAVFAVLVAMVLAMRPGHGGLMRRIGVAIHGER